MFSQTVEYALRAVICLAQHPQRLLTTQEISQATCVPVSYLSKVLQSLGRAGLISASRGIRGGYALSVNASELSILRVVNVIDPIKRIRRCPLSLDSHGERLCPLHRRLDSVLEQTERIFDGTLISELLRNDDGDVGPVPLCEIASRATSSPSSAAGGVVSLSIGTGTAVSPHMSGLHPPRHAAPPRPRTSGS